MDQDDAVTGDVDVIVVGFGSAGMTAAEFAVGLGLRVCVIERDRAGGDCLWVGCVPSKALVAAARAAHVIRTADRFGLYASMSPIDRRVVWSRVRSVRDEMAAGDDDPARFEAMGVVFRWGTGEIVGPNEVAVKDSQGGIEVVWGRMILVCTGSRPSVPAIDGLAEVGFLTTDTLFDITEVPARAVFIGGGAVSIELAQACVRLGMSVTVLESAPVVLAGEEPELVSQLEAVLERDGVEVVTGVRIERVSDGPVVHGVVNGERRQWSTDAIIVAVGRTVDAGSLGLDAVGVAVRDGAIAVDVRGRTSVESIYAAGDVTGRQMFTHVAAHQSVMALRDAFFPGRAPTDTVVPWTTFTDPELAHVGLTIAEATARFGGWSVRVHRWSLAHNDRAHTDRGEGAIVLVEHSWLGRRRLVGAHVLSPHAGELLGELVLAIERRMSVADLGSLIHVYPTIATSIQQLGGRAALEQASKYRWMMKLARGKWQSPSTRWSSRLRRSS